MKMTKKQVQKALKDLKTGLSMALAIILLTHSAQPLQAQAQVQDEAGGASEAAESADPDSTQTALEAVEPEKPLTVQEKLLEVCEANERIIDAEKCAKHLLGMVMTESNAKANAVGDKGYARGWFQINRYYNPEVDKACAEDLECSANWTLDRLLKKGYLKYSNWAIWCHNGCGIAKYYVPKVMKMAAIHWDKPIVIVTADEQRAAKAALASK